MITSANFQLEVKRHNQRFNIFPKGPCSKYELPLEGRKGTLKFSWLGEKHKGIACNLESKGHHALLNATRKVFPEAQPYSLTGSLPLVGDLQKRGFDIQITGFGRMDGIAITCEFKNFSLSCLE